MDKQEAIDFIQQGLDNQRSRDEIARELTRRTGAPHDLASKFVDQVASQRPSRPVAPPVPPASRAPEPMDRQFESQPASSTGLNRKEGRYGRGSRPGQREPEIEKFILDELLRNRKQNDIILAVCEKMEMDWAESQRLVSLVAAENRKKLATRQNIFIIPLAIGGIITGFLLVLLSASEMFRLAIALLGLSAGQTDQLPYVDRATQNAPTLFIAGLGLLLGGIVGLYRAIQAQTD